MIMEGWKGVCLILQRLGWRIRPLSHCIWMKYMIYIYFICSLKLLICGSLLQMLLLCFMFTKQWRYRWMGQAEIKWPCWPQQRHSAARIPRQRRLSILRARKPGSVDQFITGGQLILKLPRKSSAMRAKSLHWVSTVKVQNSMEYPDIDWLPCWRLSSLEFTLEIAKNQGTEIDPGVAISECNVPWHSLRKRTWAIA